MTPDWEILTARGQLLEIAELTDRLFAPVSQRPRLIANHNLHSVYLLWKNPWLRQVFEMAELTHIDGMPLVLLARLNGWPAQRRHRVTYVDWLPAVLERAATEGWRVFYLGSTAEVCERGVSEIARRFPGITVEGRHGYFDAREDSTENAAVVASIRRFKPDLLLVGMGMPRQERWILENLEACGASRALPCGAAVDFLCGAVPTPPRWMGRIGLEWLFRLVQEPRRLAARYLVEPIELCVPLLRDAVGRRLARYGRRK